VSKRVNEVLADSVEAAFARYASLIGLIAVKATEQALDPSKPRLTGDDVSHFTASVRDVLDDLDRAAEGGDPPDRLDLQNAEFDALTELCKAWSVLQVVGVVDFDYPRVRHVYEGRLKTFLAACRANGREER